MALYFFHLELGGAVIRDLEGTFCDNDHAARLHARAVARELMLHREAHCRTWKIDVCNLFQSPLFACAFVDEGETPADTAAPLRSDIDDGEQRHAPSLQRARRN